jgi:hypothetical protein
MIFLVKNIRLVTFSRKTAPPPQGRPSRTRCRGDLVWGVTFCAPQTPSTAEGRHWSFPSWGSFWHSHCVAQRIFAKRRNVSWCYYQKFFKNLPAVSLPRHNSSAQLPGDLLTAPLVWVHQGGVIPPLQPLYDSPYAVLRCGPAPSPSESGPGTRSSPSAASRLARLWTPRLAARVAAADRRVHTQAVLPQPSGSRFQTRWFLHLPLRRCHETVPEPFSYPARRFLHARDRRRLHRCHRRSTRPVNGHRHRG